MIRLTITPAAYAVIVAAQPSSVGHEQNSAPNGEFYIWLEPQYVDRLRELRTRVRAIATSSSGWRRRAKAVNSRAP
jgi:hypothetical protein